MKQRDWGKVLSTKRGKVDKRTNIAKALRQQGEKIDKKDKIEYNNEKREQVSG